MRDTPPPPPIAQRDTDYLIEDLCVALRNVGVFDHDLPDGERVRHAIAETCAIKGELDRRGVSVHDRISRLSQETRWRMDELLADCLAYPARLPFVKELDGIRRTLRCSLCRQRERPRDARVFWWCNVCVRRVGEAIEARTPVDGVILFRSYNPEARCVHADSDTVLAVDMYVEELHGYCARCLREELARRRAMPDERDK